MVHELEEISKENQEIIKLLNENRPKEVQVVQVRKVPDSWGVSISDIKSGSFDKLNLDKPLIEIKHPDKIPRTIREISITGDITFLNDAKIFVYIDGLPAFQSKSYGVSKYSAGVEIKFDNGFVLDPQKSVKIYAFTEIGSLIEVSAIVRFGE